MSHSYIFNYKVTRAAGHPYNEPPEGVNRDSHCEHYMALVRCMASNPPRLLELKDDEVVLFKDDKNRGNVYEITLAGDNPQVSLLDICLTTLAKSKEGREYILRILNKYQ